MSKKKKKKLMKIVNTDGENLDFFWTTREISMKFSGKMWLMIMLKVTKNQGFTLSLEDTILEPTKQSLLSVEQKNKL